MNGFVLPITTLSKKMWQVTLVWLDTWIDQLLIDKTHSMFLELAHEHPQAPKVKTTKYLLTSQTFSWKVILNLFQSKCYVNNKEKKKKEKGLIDFVKLLVGS